MQKILEAFEPLTEDEITANKFILFVLGTLSNKREYINPETKEMLDSNNIGYNVVPVEVNYYNDVWRSVKKTIYVIKLHNKTNSNITLRGIFDYNHTTNQLKLDRVFFNDRSYNLDEINRFKLLHALTVNRTKQTGATKNKTASAARYAYDYYRKFTNEPVEVPIKLNYVKIADDHITFNKQDINKLIKDISDLKNILYDMSRDVRQYDAGSITKAKDEWNKEYINAYKAFNADKHKAAPYAKNGELDE